MKGRRKEEREKERWCEQGHMYTTILFGRSWNSHSAPVLKLQETYQGYLPWANTEQKPYCTSAVLSNSALPKQHCTSIALSPLAYYTCSLAGKYFCSKLQKNLRDTLSEMKTEQKLKIHFPCCLWHRFSSIFPEDYIFFFNYRNLQNIPKAY